MTPLGREKSEEGKARQETSLSQTPVKEAATGRACFEISIITQLQENTD